MKQIPLTQGKFAIVDDEDFEWLSQWKWCFAGGYASRSIKGKNTHMQRLIAGTPSGMETDHINHDRLDNRRENIRICTTSQNQSNGLLSSRNTSGYKGVSFYRGKWHSKIEVNGKSIYMGTYDNPEDAAHVYDTAAKKYFGDFANTNFAI